MSDGGWIKLYRAMTEWEWYQDANTMRVFIHMLLTANIKDGTYLGVPVKRGELVTTYSDICSALGISTKSARTAINHLKRTGEVAVKHYPKFSVVSILSFDKYQSEGQGKGQAKGKQGAGKGQAIHIKEFKKERKKEEAAAPHVSPLGDSGAKVPTVTAPVVLPEGRDEYGFRWA